jgi:acyl dehydratase
VRKVGTRAVGVNAHGASLVSRGLPDLPFTLARAMPDATPTRVPSPAALADLVGREIAVGDWYEISQDRIAAFAEATDDRQWLHLDPSRAATESPYGGTIAHGLLTLSLIVTFIDRAVAIDGVRMIVNYGFDRVRFPSAVPAGARVRPRVTVGAVQQVSGAVQVTWHVTIEREGGDKPACVAEWIVRLYT